MNLVQVFIPSFDIGGARFETSYYKLVYDELLQQFGGLTAYPRGPATGLWTDDRKQIERDEIVVFEVMPKFWIGSGGRNTAKSLKFVSPRTRY